MTAAHYRYVLVEQGAAAAVINVFLNGGIAWLLFRPMTVVPLWGTQSIASDLVCTCFLLPFLACVIITALTRREVRRGRLEALSGNPGAIAALMRLPSGARLRSLALGVACTLVVAPATIGVFYALGIAELDFATFVVFKSLFAGALAAIIAPAAAVIALRN